MREAHSWALRGSDLVSWWFESTELSIVMGCHGMSWGVSPSYHPFVHRIFPYIQLGKLGKKHGGFLLCLMGKNPSWNGQPIWSFPLNPFMETPMIQLGTLTQLKCYKRSSLGPTLPRHDCHGDNNWPGKQKSLPHREMMKRPTGCSFHILWETSWETWSSINPALPCASRCVNGLTWKKKVKQ